MAAEFTHLHLHTDYSLLDGACDVDKLVKHVHSLGQTSVAMTDHGNIFGAVHFFNAAKEHGVKPILGCELYICKEEDHRAKPNPDLKYNHLLVLAENEEGYRNLVRLTSEAALHGFYRKPRVSKDFLAKNSAGLIGFSGCLAGEIAQQVMAGDYEGGKKTAGQYQDLFGKGNFFLEIQDHQLGPDKQVCDAMFQMEKELDIPLIATNDSHYIAADDSRAHEILLCVQTAGSMNDPKRFKFDTNEFYVKSAEEMSRLFAHAPHVVSGTMQFPERCNLKLSKVDNPFPAFPVPEGETLDSYFEVVCREGLQKRLSTAVEHLRASGLLKKTIPEYQARLDREIDCIKQMKFPGYFMIVWDFIRYAREQGIPVGPGRGSAAGSLVAYCMEITDIDPLQNELLFERFLNPERISMPDIDIDFCMNRRGEVIDYVKRKYGEDQVAQIITFNTMAAKAAIKDVGRATDMPYGEVDRIAKLIPATIGITIERALKDSPPLAAAYEDPKIRELIDAAMRLEGLVRGAGVHAAGVVIAPKPLTELVPVTRTKDDAVVTSYDMKSVEKMGLLKMDFLGLTTLTVIDDALKLIKSTKGVAIDLSTIALDDAVTYEKVFHRALTSGVFQFESPGMRDVLRRYKPTTVEDLTALNALYRPGPIQGGMVDEFIERKWGRRAVEYELPELEPILRETLGVMLYQEQVMQISNRLAGFSLSQADMLRRAMGKKDAAEMTKQRVQFMAGAASLKHPKDIAGNIFDLMAKFAEYGFNKSHSAAYALLAYHTAWLKTHYPVEFMAALLTSETSKPENVVKYISECREMNIPVVPPNVQMSDANFTPVTVEAGEAIGFGLAAIKNVGHNAIVSIIEARNALRAEGKQGFASLWEFCDKVDLRLLNKRVLESLIKAGAMDAFGRRGQVFAALDKAIEGAQKSQKDAAAGQHGLFGGIFDADDTPAANREAEALPAAPDWDEHTRLQNEKEVLGFFVSGHPLDRYREKLRNLKVVDTAAACEMKPEPQVFRRGSSEPQNEIQMAGVITGLKVAKSKRSGEMYAQACLEDSVGKIELIAFSTSYLKLAEKLKIDVPVLVRGALRGEEDSALKLSLSNIQALEDVVLRLPEALRIKVPLHSPDTALLEKLQAIFANAPGKGKLLLDLEEPGEFCAVLEPQDVKVCADRLFIDRVEELVGKGGVRVIE
ncbi:MAG TPA: DNA polymerase III subunit alpha [Acidobacteriaceae bacterium]|nr:DNA polymerase III subunit alpha [Acidobacteriaceae bacterium]